MKPVYHQDAAQLYRLALEHGLSTDEAAAHFGFFKDFAMINSIASSELTQRRLSWKPTHPGLIADIDANLRP